MRLRKFYPLIIPAFLFLIIYLAGRSIPEESIRSFINKGGIFSPGIFVIVMLLSNIFAPLSGMPIIFAGFYLFGNKVVFLVAVASFISFATNFWIARVWGRPIVEKLAGKGSMHKVDKLTQNYGLVALFFLRIFQGALNDFISYASGLTSLRFPSYIIVSSAALIPNTVIWYYLSLKATTPVAFTILTSAFAITLSATFVLGTVALRKLKKK